MIRSIRVILTLMLTTLIVTSPVHSCMMVPRAFQGRISQNRQQAILVQKGDRQELVLQVNYKIEGRKNLPEQFAWIVTTPTEPDNYRVTSNSTITDTSRWSRLITMPPRPDSRSLTDSRAEESAVSIAPNSIELGRRVKIGPYDVQPVRARGLEALGALNEWLKENGFPTEDPDHMAYFVQNNFTFCCIKVSPKQEGEGPILTSTRGKLPPLQLSFESSSLYYPLKFSSRQGVFDVELTTLTAEPVDVKASAGALKNLNWRPRASRSNVMVDAEHLPKELTKIISTGEVGATDTWYVNRFECHDVNRGDSIATWKSDVFLRTNEKLAGTRLQDISVEPIKQNNQLWKLGAAFTALLLGAGVMLRPKS